MDQIERETVISSLSDLESYYQSRYEYYLAMATEAKEQRERVGLLMQDLLRNIPWLEHQSLDHKGNNLELPRAHPELKKDRVDASGDVLEHDSTTRLSMHSVSQHPDSEIVDEIESDSSTQPELIKRLFQGLSKAMSAIEFTSNLDTGKSLHQSYLHKILNQELKQELNQELLELYLDEAISRGLIEPDKLAFKCYIAKGSSNNISNNLDKDNGHDPQLEQSEVPHSKNSTKYSTSEKKPYKLPPSNKLKPTLLETIEQYIAECRPKGFSIDNVINYLYSKDQQFHWSPAEKNRVRTCMSNLLSRKAYLGKYWKRVRPGMYKP